MKDHQRHYQGRYSQIHWIEKLERDLKDEKIKTIEFQLGSMIPNPNPISTAKITIHLGFNTKIVWKQTIHPCQLEQAAELFFDARRKVLSERMIKDPLTGKEIMIPGSISIATHMSLNSIEKNEGPLIKKRTIQQGIERIDFSDLLLRPVSTTLKPKTQIQIHSWKRTGSIPTMELAIAKKETRHGIDIRIQNGVPILDAWMLRKAFLFPELSGILIAFFEYGTGENWNWNWRILDVVVTQRQ